jgi:hypothetical protein
VESIAQARASEGAVADVPAADPSTGGTAQPAPHMESVIDLTEGEDERGVEGGEANAPSSAADQGAPVAAAQMAPEGLQASPPRPDVVQVAEATQAPAAQIGATTGGGCRPHASRSPAPLKKASRWPRLEPG